jgi:hypothetical protein
MTRAKLSFLHERRYHFNLFWQMSELGLSDQMGCYFDGTVSYPRKEYDYPLNSTPSPLVRNRARQPTVNPV